MTTPTLTATVCIRSLVCLWVVGALSILAACGGGGGQAGGGAVSPQQTAAGQSPAQTAGSPTATPTMVPTPITVQDQRINYHGQESVVGKDSATIDLYDNYFEPSVLIGSPGQRLTVNLVNEGEIPHTFTMQPQDIDAVLDPGQSMQVQVTFPQSTREDFICRFHLAQGMAGILVVSS